MRVRQVNVWRPFKIRSKCITIKKHCGAKRVNLRRRTKNCTMMFEIHIETQCKARTERRRTINMRLIWNLFFIFGILFFRHAQQTKRIFPIDMIMFIGRALNLLRNDWNRRTFKICLFEYGKKDFVIISLRYSWPVYIKFQFFYWSK